MTNSSKPTGVTLALAFFMVLSAICGAGWYQAHNRAVELSEQRIRDLEQRLTTFIDNKNVAIPSTEKSREIANRASAEVLISRHRPHVIGDRAEVESPDEFEVYRQTQSRMVKSPFVLAAALRNPAIANLELLKGQPHPAKFLEERLEIDFPATEFMRISFDGARSPDAAKIVNAVVTEYLNEVANAENNARTTRIMELEKAHHDLAEQLRTRRAALKKLVANLQTGDKEAITEKQKMMIELNSLLRKERAQKHFELMSARIKLAALEDAADAGAVADLTDKTVEEQLGLHPQISQAQADLDRKRESFDKISKASKNAESAHLIALKNDLQAAQMHLETLKEKTRGIIAEKLRADEAARVQASKLQLRDNLRVTELTIKQLDEEMEKQKVETQQTGQWSLEIETLREDLEQARRIDQRLTEETERLKIELKAGSRVALHREAEA